MTSTPQCEKPEPDNAEVMLGGITPPPANEQTSDVAVHEQVLEDNQLHGLPVQVCHAAALRPAHDRQQHLQQLAPHQHQGGQGCGDVLSWL